MNVDNIYHSLNIFSNKKKYHEITFNTGVSKRNYMTFDLDFSCEGQMIEMFGQFIMSGT